MCSRLCSRHGVNRNHRARQHICELMSREHMSGKRRSVLPRSAGKHVRRACYNSIRPCLLGAKRGLSSVRSLKSSTIGSCLAFAGSLIFHFCDGANVRLITITFPGPPKTHTSARSKTRYPKLALRYKKESRSTPATKASTLNMSWCPL